MLPWELISSCDLWEAIQIWEVFSKLHGSLIVVIHHFIGVESKGICECVKIN